MQDLAFPSWPQYEPDEIAAVTRVLESGKVNYWTGEEGRKFEREFAEYHGAEYGVAVANGTVALELGLYALGIGEGDEVIVTPRTFLASASSIVLRGARPVFADVDRNSGNITPETVRQVITKKTRAVMPVHLAGWPCDMPGFRTLADEFGLYLIEDCAQAHGASVDGRLVGSFGHVAAFSFCTDKIMTTGGEGGMVLSSDQDMWQRMWEYKDHGKSWDAVYNREHPPGFRWLHESFGTNWRLTEMQSAIGRVQLGKLDKWIERRRENAKILIDGLSGLPGLRVPVPDEGFEHAYYKFYVYVEPERLKDGWSRDRIMEAVADQGVPCMQGICPEVYLEKAFGVQGSRFKVQEEGSEDGGKRAEDGRRKTEDGRRKTEDGGRKTEDGRRKAEDGRRKTEDGGRKTEDRGQMAEECGRLPVAMELGETSLMFLVHPTLGEKEMVHTVRVVREVMGVARRS